MTHAPRYRDAHIERDEARGEFDRASATSRWVTVCGPPGVGKSRGVAAWLSGAGRVCWVDLAGVLGEDAALEALRRELGVEREGGALEEQLAWALSTRGVEVLVWDNADESGLGERAAALLDGAEGLSVCATSRGRLGVDGERVVALTPLAPDEGVRLLRARAGEHGVECLEEDSAELERIVRALDGLPMALELAANWLEMLGARELAQRLSGGEDLLDAMPIDDARYTTLHQAVAWSWSQLGEVERSVLTQCGSWRGSFSLDDACAFVEARGVLGALHGLHGMGLLRSSRAGGARFELYGVVREVALASGAREVVEGARGRLTGWLVARARRGESAEHALETAIALVSSAECEERAWLCVLASRSLRARGELGRAEEVMELAGDVESGPVVLERARVRFAQGRYGAVSYTHLTLPTIYSV